MRKLIFAFLLFTSHFGFSQPQFLQRNLLIIKKGFCRDETRNCINAAISYLKACDSLGNYYYDLKDYKNAFKYYSLVANLRTSHADGDLIDNDTVLKTHNFISVKAGDMLFLGLGCKKDLVASYQFHNSLPNYLPIAERNRLSKLHFNTIKDIFPLSITDTFQQFAINPFYIYDIATTKKIDDYLRNIDEKITVDTSLRCTIVLNKGAFPLSELSQGYLALFIRKLKIPRNSKFSSHYSTDIEFDDSPGYEISGILFPTLFVKLTKQDKS
jgi:hypothetical protein